MPVGFVFLLIFAALTVICFIWWRKTPKTAPSEDEWPIKSIAHVVTIVLLVVTLVIGFFSSFNIVSTKNVGIQTRFGKPVATLSNGPHFIPPWDKVTELDGSIQTDTHSGTPGEGNASPCITVRIAQQSTACANVTVVWRINKDANDANDGNGTVAEALYADYRNFDNIRQNLVALQIGATLNRVFGTYDPLSIDTDGESTTETLDSLSARAESDLQERVGNKVEIIDVLILTPNLDADTQNRLNLLNTEVANTRVAKQRQQTAKAAAAANRELADSVSQDPNVLVSRCLDLLNDLQAANQPIPAGFSCWPGGSDTPVIVNSTTPQPSNS